MSQWIEKLTQPLPENAVGSDPRHSDDFYLLKEEFSKLSGIDYGLVQQKAEDILQHQAKDLRVVSYLLLARLHLDGTVGLREALQLYSKLVEQYGDQLYPQKASSKVISLQWLNDNKIKQTVKHKIDLDDHKQVKQLTKAIEQTNQQLQTKLGVEIKLFSNILPLLREKQRQTAMSDVAPVQLQQAANDIPVVAATNLECQSEQQLRDLTRIQLSYMRQQQQWLRAIAYSRAYRWSTLSSLSAEANITAVPAPDEAMLDRFNRVVENATPMEVLSNAEDLFMAKGGLYYFDLHYHQIIAAKTMGLVDVATYIEDALRQLLLRDPRLINYFYSNELPFISQQYRPWCESLLKPTSTQASNTDVSVELSLQDIVNSYRATVAGKPLSEKIAAMQTLNAENQRIHCLQQLALARFCVEDKRIDLAIPILQNLADVVQQHQLQQWEPEFALYVWSELLAAWKQQLSKLDKDMQKTVKQKLETLFNQICMVDLRHAIDMRFN